MITRHFMRTRQLKPGMKLDQTILDRTGRNLVMRGSILDDYVIDSLLRMGIMNVYIQEGEPESAIEDVVSVIYTMIDGINTEKSSTENTAKSFDNIQTNTYTVRDNVSRLSSSIDELKQANSVIVDSIQTISAVSEQLSAHAAETTNTEDANIKILESINTRMHSLIDTIKHNNQ